MVPDPDSPTHMTSKPAPHLHIGHHVDGHSFSESPAIMWSVSQKIHPHDAKTCSPLPPCWPPVGSHVGGHLSPKSSCPIHDPFPRSSTHSSPKSLTAILAATWCPKRWFHKPMPNHMIMKSHWISHWNLCQHDLLVLCWQPCLWPSWLPFCSQKPLPLPYDPWHQKVHCLTGKHCPPKRASHRTICFNARAPKSCTPMSWETGTTYQIAEDCDPFKKLPTTLSQSSWVSGVSDLHRSSAERIRTSIGIGHRLEALDWWFLKTFWKTLKRWPCVFYDHSNGDRSTYGFLQYTCKTLHSSSFTKACQTPSEKTKYHSDSFEEGGIKGSSP